MAIAAVVVLVAAASSSQWMPPLQTWWQGTTAGFAPQDEKLTREANELMDHMEYEQALKLLDSAISMNPANIEAHRARAEANYVLNNYEDAIPDLELVLQPNITQNPEVYLEQSVALAKCCEKTKRYDRGIQALKDVLKVGAAKKTEQLQDVNHKLAVLYLMKGDEGSAADWYDNAIESPPFKLPLYLEYADLLHRMEDYKTEFEVLFEAQQQANPNDPQLKAATDRLSNFFWNRGHKVVMASHHTSFDGYLDGAYCFLLQRQYESAYKAGEKLITLDPKRPEGFRVEADNYMLLKRYKDAVAAFTDALLRAPNDTYLQDRKKEAEEHIPAPLPKTTN